MYDEIHVFIGLTNNIKIIEGVRMSSGREMVASNFHVLL